ncbi:hypothetical protein [Streptomyces sp. NPDC001507]|uniref:hypothetical protein n=1 Tax=Streptomyces sp. NPDC001507 TaxID=3364579 RepID=UPI0036BBE30F
MTENVIQLHKTPPPGMSTDTLTETVIDVIHDAEPQPVDPPSPAPEPGSWLAERKAYLADAPPVVPAAFRRWDTFKDATRWTVSYYAHVSAFHTVRAPAYLARLLLRSPAVLAG